MQVLGNILFALIFKLHTFIIGFDCSLAKKCPVIKVGFNWFTLPLLILLLYKIVANIKIILL